MMQKEILLYGEERDRLLQTVGIRMKLLVALSGPLGVAFRRAASSRKRISRLRAGEFEEVHRYQRVYSEYQRPEKYETGSVRKYRVVGLGGQAYI